MFIEFSYAISPQNTHDESCFYQKEALNYFNNQLKVIEPKYNDIIPINLLRRMGRAVRLGVGGSLELILKNNLNPEAILCSSAVGGLEDCIKFLDQIYSYNEGTLTPTNFVQSTPNAIAGGLALLTKNNSYNTTHVNGANSFIDCLLEAKLLLNEGKIKSCLVTNVEEISSYNYNINFLSGHYKSKNIASLDLLNEKSIGSICGEGSAIFYITPYSNKYEAEIISFFNINKKLSIDDILSKIYIFLKENKIEKNLISDVILGYNGDFDSDVIYKKVENEFDLSNIYSYKNLVGEYPTSVSFALWLGIKLFQNKEISNSIIRSFNKSNREFILIYNHYNLIEHSFILIKKGNLV